MNIRTALLLGLAGMAASTTASAGVIAGDYPLSGIVMRPTEFVLATDAVRPGALNALSSGSSAVTLADTAAGPTAGLAFTAGWVRDRRDNSGTWRMRTSGAHDADAVVVAPAQGSAPSPANAAVSVPEPATLGLLGLGLLLLTVFTRRARLLLRRPSSIA